LLQPQSLHRANVNDSQIALVNAAELQLSNSQTAVKSKPNRGCKPPQAPPEQPKQLMSNLVVVDGSLQQKLDQLTLEIRLVLESLYELQQILEQLRVTAANYSPVI